MKHKEFPHYLAKPAQRALSSQGIAILNDLSRFTKSEIKGLHGIGPHAFRKMQEEMWEEGISFKKEKWRDPNELAERKPAD